MARNGAGGEPRDLNVLQIADLLGLFGVPQGQVKVVSRPEMGTIDVTAAVEAFDLSYGFILMSPDTPRNAPQNNYYVPTATNTCLTKFSTPSLQVVYF